jgi:hypothetical protein
MVHRHGNDITVQPDALPEYGVRGPVIKRLRGREDTGIVPCPEQGKDPQDKSIPPKSELAPEREDEDRQNGIAQGHAPWVGMAQQGRVVQCKGPGNPPFNGHLLRVRVACLISSSLGDVRFNSRYFQKSCKIFNTLSIEC